jgi:hypothetical protein
MSTRGATAATDEREMWVEGRHDRLELAREAGWGGVSWRSVMAGVFAAFGAIGACIGIAAAVLYPMGFTLDNLSDDDWRRAGLIAGLASAGVFLGAFTFGGYTAGRMARRAGLRNGVLAGVLGVLVLAAVGAVAQLEGAISAVVDRLESLGAPTDGSTWFGLGVLTGAVALGGMILGGLLVRAASPDVGPDAELRAEADRQRRAAEKALARANKAGVVEDERTDTPMPGVRMIPAGDHETEGEVEEERDRTRSAPEPTGAGPRMPPSS